MSRIRRRCGAGYGGITRRSPPAPRPRRGPSSGVTRPACAPMTCAAAAMRLGAAPRRCGATTSGPISAVTNKGELRWMVLDGAVKAPSLLRFLARLVRDAGRKVFLILDRLPVHRSAKLRAWLAGREAEIEVFYLPGYSPELNPDEGINGDLKQAVTREEPARSKAQLKRAAIGHMRRLSKLPNRVRSFFRHSTFRYAA